MIEGLALAVVLGVIVVITVIAISSRASRTRTTAEQPSTTSSRPSGWEEDVGQVRIAVHRSFLTLLRRAGPETWKGLGQVPLFFIDVTASGESLVFAYLPGGAHSAIRRVEVGAEQSTELAAALRSRFGLPLDRRVRDVTIDDLRRAPAGLHGEVVRLRARWSTGFESSLITDETWLRPPEGVSAGAERRARDVEVLGLMLWHGAARGLGHLGLMSGELIAFELRDAEVHEAARGSAIFMTPRRRRPTPDP
jgi:hypothetical protein